MKIYLAYAASGYWDIAQLQKYIKNILCSFYYDKKEISEEAKISDYMNRK